MQVADDRVFRVQPGCDGEHGLLERVGSDRVQTNFAKLGTLTFEEPDTDRFPSLNLARRAGEVGGTLPAVLNAANEVAVEAFCNRQIKFTDIFAAVTRAMEMHRIIEHPSLEQILEADAWARSNTLNGANG